MTIFFNGVPADQVLFVSDGSDLSSPYRDDAWASERSREIEGGWGTLEDGFTYFSPIQIDALEPNNGSTIGGTQVTMMGLGFMRK